MSARGVTLLEILVVVLVVGVLAALALPTYRQHMVRVHRTEAITLLYDIAAAEERFYLKHGRYVDDVSAAPPLGLGLGSAAGARHYVFSVAMAGDGQTFIATGAPRPGGGQESDSDCLAFSLDHRGRRAVSGSRDTSFCWR